MATLTLAALILDAAATAVADLTAYNGGPRRFAATQITLDDGCVMRPFVVRRGENLTPTIHANADAAVEELMAEVALLCAAADAADADGMNAVLRRLRSRADADTHHWDRVNWADEVDLEQVWACVRERGRADLNEAALCEIIQAIDAPGSPLASAGLHIPYGEERVATIPAFPKALLARIRAWQARGGRPAESELLALATHNAEAEAGYHWFSVPEREAVFTADALRRMARGEPYRFPQAA